MRLNNRISLLEKEAEDFRGEINHKKKIIRELEKKVIDREQ